MAMNVNSILALKEELSSKYSGLVKCFDEYEKACFGGLIEDRLRTGGFPLDSEDPRPDHIATERNLPDFVIPVCRPIAYATRSYLGQLPNLRVPPIDDNPDNLVITEKEEMCGLGLWRFWNMRQRMLDIGFHDGVHGTAIGVMWPDIERELPRLLVYSPRGVFPVMRGQDPTDIACCLFVNKYSGRQVAKMFPGARGIRKLETEDEVEVIQYIDDKVITTLANDTRVDGIEHNLGFCPVVFMPNECIPGSPFGEPPIAQVTKMQKSRNYIYNLQMAMAEEQLSQPIVLEGAENFPDGIPMGSRDTIELQAGVGAKAFRLPPPTIPFDTFRITEDLSKQIAVISDIPQAMTGGLESQYMSGNAFNTQLGPTQAKLGIRAAANIYPAIEKLMWMAFKMMEIMWPGAEHTVYGSKDKTSFSKTFTVEEFNGWYEFEVVLDATQYFDQQTTVVQLLQLVQNQLVSKETAMQWLPFVRDIPTEKRRISRETEENVKMNLAAQQAAEANVQPPMGEQGRTNYGLEQGYVGEVEPAPIPGGAELKANTGALGAEKGQSEGVDPLLQQAADLFRSIPNIKGRIWMVGNFLEEGYRESNSGMGKSPKIELALSDKIDKATILRYVEKTAPDVHGKITWYPDVVTEAPAGIPSLEVTPGSQGYEVQSVSPEGTGPETGNIPEAGNAEEDAMLAQMMGGA